MLGVGDGLAADINFEGHSEVGYVSLAGSLIIVCGQSPHFTSLYIFRGLDGCFSISCQDSNFR